MAPIKIVLKEPVSDLMYFERNIKEISHAGETLPCSGINLQFNFAGMEYMTLTIPMNFVEIEVARNEY